ncbi:MAG TPA: flagellar hook-basal body complex protein FliE [Opitutaceae bacterium]|jgi:flagellar hook-basal body complex protein FliE
MSPIGSVGSTYGLPLVSPTDGARTQALDLGGSKPTQSFGQVVDGLLSTVSAKQAEANQVTQNVLMGDSGQLHQSVIAMQEASVSFSLMVEVRNKLVESYQELMRMQA